METAKLKATIRDQFGKGPSRRLRATERIPAVIYGKGMDTTSILISPKELLDAVSSEFGPNRILEVEIENRGTHRALLTEFQRHPVSRNVLHADFKLVDDASKIVVRVPLKLVGKAKGLVLGGFLKQVFRTLPVRCLPANIPASIEYDVSDVGLEESVSVSNLTLPEGVEVMFPPSRTIGGVYGARQKPDAEEEAAAAGAAAGAAAPAGAKPEAAGAAEKKPAEKKG